ncbi:unnamed protein product [Cyclocybe aegerita]|uniref:Uncharacterized protein n=1 Tax=Cyclocybe aegerita TaxID=1973307 RepID=A0A8S0WP99_CYCAE|nr:unnamed protein product [Cyclocybe aegerita]
MKFSILTALALAAVSVQAQVQGASKNVALSNSRPAGRTAANTNAAPPKYASSRSPGVTSTVSKPPRDNGTSSGDGQTSGVSFGVFTFTDVTPVGAGPANGPTSAGYTIPQYTEGVRQSAIWNYDRATQTVKPVWINPDGSALNITIHYDARESGFFFTGDPDAYAAKYGVDFIECMRSIRLQTLTFVPIPWTVA